jgi:hypothetical protein
VEAQVSESKRYGTLREKRRSDTTVNTAEERMKNEIRQERFLLDG